MVAVMRGITTTRPDPTLYLSTAITNTLSVIAIPPSPHSARSTRPSFLKWPMKSFHTFPPPEGNASLATLPIFAFSNVLAEPIMMRAYETTGISICITRIAPPMTTAQCDKTIGPVPRLTHSFRSCQADIESPPIREKPNIPPLITPHRGEDDHLLLPPFESVDRADLDILELPSALIAQEIEERCLPRGLLVEVVVQQTDLCCVRRDHANVAAAQ